MFFVIWKMRMFLRKLISLHRLALNILLTVVWHEKNILVGIKVNDLGADFIWKVLYLMENVS